MYRSVPNITGSTNAGETNLLRKAFRLAFICALTMLAASCGRPRPGQAVGIQDIAEDTQPPKRRISIMFGGDVMQHMPQVHAAKTGSGYDYSRTFMYLEPVFDTADLVIVNLETTLNDDGDYSGYPLFGSPAGLAAGLKQCGVDAVVLANNHCADKGRQGIVSTIEALDAAGLRHTGVFADSTDYGNNNPLYLEAEGLRLALLNYTYGLNGMPVPAGTLVNLIDTARIAADIAKIDPATDYIAVFFHWGEEYRSQPNRHQKELAGWCHRKGVDFVIGSHPHVIQPVVVHADTVGGPLRLTAYSLGNLVSNQRRRYTDGGMLLGIEITRRPHSPDTIKASCMLTWVHTPVENGRRRYIILPAPVADTLLRDGTQAKATYTQFIKDSRALLNDPMLHEIRHLIPEKTADSLLREFSRHRRNISHRPGYLRAVIPGSLCK